MKMLLAYLAVTLALVTVGSAVTEGEITAVRNYISTFISQNERRNIPLLVRLAFHDAVGDSGADGCLDPSIPDNAGLGPIYASITNLYSTGRSNGNIPADVSQADFIALAGVEASSRGIQNGNGGRAPAFPFSVGRQTTTNCVGSNTGNFPRGQDGYGTTINYLRNQFGLTENEAIALLGAHSLGGAQENNSGFRGVWTNQQDSLNNAYYRILLDAQIPGKTWTQQKTKKNLYQWQPPPKNRRELAQRNLLENLLSLMAKSRNKRQAPPGGLFMLNSDMCLVSDITITNAQTGQANCQTGVSACPFSNGRNEVQRLSQSNNAFITSYINAFTKMINKVGTQGVTLTSPTPGGSVLAPAPAPGANDGGGNGGNGGNDGGGRGDGGRGDGGNRGGGGGGRNGDGGGRNGGGGGRRKRGGRDFEERRALKEIVSSLLEAVEETELE